MAMRRIVKHFIGHSGRCWHALMLPHFGRTQGFFNLGNPQTTDVYLRELVLYLAGGSANLVVGEALLHQECSLLVQIQSK